MAFYGIVGGSNTVSGSTSADTIAFLNSTARASAVSILGLDGNDLINLGPRGYTAHASAINTFTGVIASGTGALLSATLVGSATYSTGTSISGAMQGAGTEAIVGISAILTSQRGARTIAAAQFYGNAGNDTIYMGQTINSITSTTIGGGAGNDVITNAYYINGASANATSTIDGSTGTAFTANKLMIEAGGGNDTISLDWETTATLSNTTIGGGQGNDQIQITGVATGAMTTSQIVMGGGDDTLTATFNNAYTTTINGGGGKDTIQLQILSAASALVIDGDYNGTLSDYDDADLITAVGTNTSGEIAYSTIYGGGGNDTVNWNISAMTATTGGNLFSLNVGDDLVSAYALDNDTIQAGAGADSITVGTSVLSSLFNLGGGKDTFTFSAGTTDSGALFSGNTIYGGAGADVFSAVGGIGDITTAGAVWGITSYSDSTLSARDTITFGSTATSTIYRLRFDAGSLSTGSFRTGDQSATDGVVTFTAGTDSSVTARAAIIDGSMTTVGATVGFEDGSERVYLFVQGGATDTVIQLGNGSNTAVSALSIVGGTTLNVVMGL